MILGLKYILFIHQLNKTKDLKLFKLLKVFQIRMILISFMCKYFKKKNKYHHSNIY